MPKGRVEPREVFCKACGYPFVTDKVGKAAELCHAVACDAARERARKSRRRAEVESRARQREQEAAERREERERQRRIQRATEARRKAVAAKLRKKGLEVFAPIMDDPDQKLMLADILEIVELASEHTDPGWVDLRKAITAVAVARPEGREKSHAALQRLSAVAMKMADSLRTHATRDPKPDEDLAEDDEPALVAA
jgi:hypothetical protein